MRRIVKRLYDRRKNWRVVGSEMGISSGMAYRLANELDYEPKSLHIRHLLGLPTLIPTPTCHVCGEVHLRKSCPRRSGHRRSTSVNLGNLSDEERSMIAALTPAQRKELLIEAIKKASDN